MPLPGTDGAGSVNVGQAAKGSRGSAGASKGTAKAKGGKRAGAAKGSASSNAKKAGTKKTTEKKTTKRTTPTMATKTGAKGASTKSTSKKKGSAKSPIPAKTLTKLRARLEEERETYGRQAEDLAAEAEALMADREPGDTQFDEESGEGDTIAVERERDLALSATARQAVEEIDAALARMDAGTYGICARCGNKIPVARLEAVPQAALCIECKARQERRR